MAYKSSRQREIIMAYMDTIQGHMSAEMIYENINQGGQIISLATLYRNLNILSDLKKIKKIALNEGYVYDKTCQPHYHFYCTKCKVLYDLPHKYDISLHNKMNQDAMIGNVEEHELTLKGVCRKCMLSH